MASAGTKKEEVHFLSKSYSRLSCVNTDGQFDFENAKIRLGPAPLALLLHFCLEMETYTYVHRYNADIYLILGDSLTAPLC